jgi:hypothetical protein
MLSPFSTKARRRARRQHAVAVEAITGPTPVDLARAVIEEIINSGWRVRCGNLTLAWGLASREIAERYLAGLVEQQQRMKDTHSDGR